MPSTAQFFDFLGNVFFAGAILIPFLFFMHRIIRKAKTDRMMSSNNVDRKVRPLDLILRIFASIILGVVYCYSIWASTSWFPRTKLIFQLLICFGAVWLFFSFVVTLRVLFSRDFREKKTLNFLLPMPAFPLYFVIMHGFAYLIFTFHQYIW